MVCSVRVKEITLSLIELFVDEEGNFSDQVVCKELYGRTESLYLDYIIL